MLWSEEGTIEKSEYLGLWKDLGDASESVLPINLFSSNVDVVLAKLLANNVFTIARREDKIYLSLKFTNNISALAELTVAASGSKVLRRFLTSLESPLFAQIVVDRSASQCRGRGRWCARGIRRHVVIRLGCLKMPVTHWCDQCRRCL